MRCDAMRWRVAERSREVNVLRAGRAVRIVPSRPSVASVHLRRPSLDGCLGARCSSAHQVGQWDNASVRSGGWRVESGALSASGARCESDRAGPEQPCRGVGERVRARGEGEGSFVREHPSPLPPASWQALASVSCSGNQNEIREGLGNWDWCLAFIPTSYLLHTYYFRTAASILPVKSPALSAMNAIDEGSTST